MGRHKESFARGVGPRYAVVNGLSVLLSLTLGGCMLLDSFIFFPDRQVPDAPPPGVEEQWITTQDGVRLHAWRASAPASRATLIWSHGNAGNIAGRVDLQLALAARGLDVLAYDYRGYGKSEGRPTEQGVYRDAEAAFDSERDRGTDPSRIVCFGESVGGAVSLRLATVRPCAAVVVVSTFTRLADVARLHYGPLAAVVGDRFDSLARVRELSAPVFIAHGDEDEIVPYALGERLFEAVRGPKEFLRIRGAHHNDIFAYAELTDAIADFVARVVTK